MSKDDIKSLLSDANLDSETKSAYIQGAESLQNLLLISKIVLKSVLEETECTGENLLKVYQHLLNEIVFHSLSDKMKDLSRNLPNNSGSIEN